MSLCPCRKVYSDTVGNDLRGAWAGGPFLGGPRGPFEEGEGRTIGVRLPPYVPPRPVTAEINNNK